MNAAASSPPRDGRWYRNLGAVPGLGIALVPACPACWPAYAGLVSAAGLGPLLNVRWQLPLTALLLAAALGTLTYRARRRRGYGPLALGVCASGVVLGGKFLLLSNPVAYAGAALLVIATIWNAWPRRTAAACETCATGEPRVDAVA